MIFFGKVFEGVQGTFIYGDW